MTNREALAIAARAITYELCVRSAHAGFAARAEYGRLKEARALLYELEHAERFYDWSITANEHRS